MNRFIRELRRREVFRTAGLYVGVAWILIEGASVVLPVFEAPDWMMRALIVTAVVGFPVMLVLAWIFDVSARGIEVQGDPSDTIVPPLGSRRMDFVVIGVLSVALIMSVYLNVTGGPELVEQHAPVSVMIADFENLTGDPVFDGSLEQVLQIGIEGASFTTTYPRRSAERIAQSLRPGTTGLPADVAQLVSIREGVSVTVMGKIEAGSSGYEFTITAMDTVNGVEVVELGASANNKIEVLTAIGDLAGKLREALGDKNVGVDGDGQVETFSAASLEAVQDYTTAQALALKGERDRALDYYAAAVEKDPDFGRALSGWALTLFNLGRDDEASAMWERALSKMETMTPRERYRTLGLYYMAVTGNYEAAIDNYEALVEAYPADNAAHNNLAIAYFATLDFASATHHGSEALKIYPNSVVMQSNYALYAMYAGEWEKAQTEAEKTLELDAARYVAWLPIAMAKAAAGDFGAAASAYDSMKAVAGSATSLASLGKADLEMSRGDFDAAVATLKIGTELDIASGNNRALATKQAVLADAYAELGLHDEARMALEAAVATGGSARLVPAALIYSGLGDYDAALGIAETLGARLQPQSRAYGRMLEGVVALAQGDTVDAVDKLNAALEFSDMWLVRFHLGRAYVESGFPAEALGEFEACTQRLGEATSLFLDDQPTWRYTSVLPYWVGRAEEALGMTHSAKQRYREFVTNRPVGTLADDARSRF